MKKACSGLWNDGIRYLCVKENRDISNRLFKNPYPYPSLSLVIAFQFALIAGLTKSSLLKLMAVSLDHMTLILHTVVVLSLPTENTNFY